MKKLLIAALAASLSLPAISAAPAYAGGFGHRHTKDVCHPNYEPEGGYPGFCFEKNPEYRLGTKHYNPRHKHLGGGGDVGAAIALGIVGLAVGAMIANSANRAEQQDYYPPAPRPCDRGFVRGLDGNCYPRR